MKSQGFTDSEVCWSFLMMWSCSYLFNGLLEPIDLKKDQPLSGGQIESMLHFGNAAQRFLVSDEKGSTLELLRSSLSEKALGIGGVTSTNCRELVAELTVPTWPAPGRAAVQPAVRFLDGDLLRQVLQPRTMLNPVELWPEEPRLGIVHATQEEWNLLVKAGFERGIFYPIEENDVLTDHNGVPVYSGAMGVDKWKLVDRLGKPSWKRLLRFISIMCPANDYFKDTEPGEVNLPYVGQLTLLTLHEANDFVLDSSDLESCFNLFTMPESFRAFTAFEKKVPGECLGRPGAGMVRPCIGTIPMGFCKAVTICQAILRKLVHEAAAVPRQFEIHPGVPVPDEEMTAIFCLDSFDFLREIEPVHTWLLQGESSMELKRFLKVCDDYGLPRASAKNLVGAFV
jgi:hypothetical protein